MQNHDKNKHMVVLSVSIRNQSDFETSWLGSKLFLLNCNHKYLIIDIYKGI